MRPLWVVWMGKFALVVVEVAAIESVGRGAGGVCTRPPKLVVPLAETVSSVRRDAYSEGDTRDNACLCWQSSCAKTCSLCATTTTDGGRRAALEPDMELRNTCRIIFDFVDYSLIVHHVVTP